MNIFSMRRILAGLAIATVLSVPAHGSSGKKPAPNSPTVSYGSINIDGLNIAYREAGDAKNPKIVLLHGFPAGSHQYRDLMRSLAGKFHVIAPDYPGFGLIYIPYPAT